MTTQEFTVLGITGIAGLAGSGQQLFYVIMDWPTPRTSVLVASVLIGLALIATDIVIVSLQQGRRRK